jgi:hypothetical protein
VYGIGSDFKSPVGFAAILDKVDVCLKRIPQVLEIEIERFLEAQ